MAFPSTSVLDAFNRANGALGANWGGPIDPSDTVPTIFSNAMVGTASVFNSAYWNVSTYLNTECYFTYTSDEWVYAFSRIGAPNTAGLDCVFSRVRDSGNEIETYIVVDGATVASDTTTGAITGSGQFGTYTRNSGDDILVDTYLNGSIIRSSTFTGAVSLYPAVAVAGYLGVALYGDGDSLTRSIDDFGGGTPSGAGPGDDPPIGFLGRGAGW